MNATAIHLQARPEDSPVIATTVCGIRAAGLPRTDEPGRMTCADCHAVVHLQLLEEIGARVIRVEDLGAALEAREIGGLAVQGITDTRQRPPASDAMFGLSTIVAIRKARLALGHTD